MRDLFVSRPKNEERAPMKVRTKLDFRQNGNVPKYGTAPTKAWPYFEAFILGLDVFYHRDFLTSPFM